MKTGADKLRFQRILRRHLAGARARFLLVGLAEWLGAVAATAGWTLLLAGLPGSLPAPVRIVMLALAAVPVVLVARRALLRPLARLGGLRRFARALERRGDFHNQIVAAEEASRLPARWDRRAGVSEALVSRLLAAAAGRVATLDPRRLLPVPDAAGRVAAFAVAALCLAWIVVVQPPVVVRGWQRLSDPLRPENPAPASGLYLEAGPETVAAGGDLLLAARDFGSPRGPVVCEVRFGRADWTSLPAAPDSAAEGPFHRYTTRIERVTDPLAYRFRRDGLVTPERRVEVLHPPLLTGFAARVEPPAYTRLPAADHPRVPARLRVPEGSRVAWRGRVDRPVARAFAATGAGDTLDFTVRGDSLARAGRIDEPLSFTLHLEDERGLRGGGGLGYELLIVPDAQPRARLLRPDDDGLLPLDGRIVLRAEVEDDFGLEGVALQYRSLDETVILADDEAAWIPIPLTPPPADAAAPREAVSPLGRAAMTLLGPEPPAAAAAKAWDLLLDAGDLDLVPGDVLRLRLVALDNRRPGPPGRGVSREILLTVPSAAEVLAEESATEADRLADLEELRERSARMSADLERIERELRRDPEPDFARRQEMEGAVARQDQLQQELSAMANALRQDLDDLAARNLTSVPLLEKMEEVAALLDALQSEELDRLRERMREAMDRLAPEEIREAIEDVARRQQEFAERLDRAIALLREMQRQQELEGLTAMIERMIREQQELIDAAAESEPQAQGERPEQGDPGDQEQLSSEAAEQARRQEALARELARLEERLQELLERALSERAPSADGSPRPSDEALEKALREALAELAEEAAESSMDEAARRLDEQSFDEAGKSQREAMRSLASLYSVLRRGQESMEAAMEQHVVEGLRGLAFDVIALSRRQEEIAARIPGDLSGLRATGLTRGQGRVLRATRSLRERVREVLGMSPMISGRLIADLDRVTELQDASLRNLEAGWGSQARESARDGLGAMNRFVINLLTSAQSVSQGGSGGMPSPAFSQRLQQMAREQAGLNGLSDMLNRQRRANGLSEETRAGMERLRGDQQRLARGMAELAEREGREAADERRLLGDLEDLAAEMESVVRDLGEGVLDDDVLRRQERILSRMLDAHNSVRERDFSTRRESRGAVGSYAPQRGETGPPPDAGDTDAFELRRRRIEQLPLEYRDLVRRYFRALERARAEEAGGES